MAQPLFHINMFLSLAGRSKEGKYRMLIGDSPISANILGTSLDITRRKERLWYFAAANNTLVQMSNDKGKIVWLPTYGHGQWKSLSSTYKANSEIWQNLGFEGETFTHLQKTWVLFTTLKIFETW